MNLLLIFFSENIMKKILWILAAAILIIIAILAFRIYTVEKAAADNSLRQGTEQLLKSKYAQSLDSFNRSLSLYTKFRDKKGQAKVNLQLTRYYLETLDPDRAKDSAVKSLNLFKETEDRQGTFQAVVALADAYQQKKEIDKAGNRIEEAWNLIEKGFPDNLLVDFHLARGRIESQKRKADLAFRDFNESYVLSEKGNDINLQFAALNELAVFFSRADDSASARKYFDMGLKLTAKTDRKYFQAVSAETEGWIFQSENKKEETRKAWLKSLALYKSMGNSGKEIETLLNLAWISSSLQDQEKAHEYILNALKQSKSSNNQYLRMLSAWYLKNFITMTRNPDDLLLVMGEYEEIAGTGKDPVEKAKAYYHLGELMHYMKGDLKQSESAYTNAEKYYGEAGDKKWQVTTLLDLSMIQAKQGKLDQSLETCRKALAIRQEIGEVRKEDDPDFYRFGSISEINRRMAHAYRSRKNYEKALEFYGKALDYDKSQNMLKEKINDLNFIFDTSMEISDSDKAWKALAEFLEDIPLQEDPADRVSFYSRIFIALIKTPANFESDKMTPSPVKTESAAQLAVMKKLLADGRLYRQTLISFERSLEQAENQGLSAEYGIWFHRFQGKMNSLSGKNREALAEYGKAMSELGKTGNGEDMAEVALAMGDIYRTEGKEKDALPLYLKALDLCRENSLPDSPEKIASGEKKNSPMIILAKRTAKLLEESGRKEESLKYRSFPEKKP